MPTTCKSPIDVDVIAIGHGKTGNAGSVSMQLKYTQLKTVALKDCSDVFPIFNYFDTYVCAKDANEGLKSICNGKNELKLIEI